MQIRARGIHTFVYHGPNPLVFTPRRGIICWLLSALLKPCVVKLFGLPCFPWTNLQSCRRKDRYIRLLKKGWLKMMNRLQKQLCEIDSSTVWFWLPHPKKILSILLLKQNGKMTVSPHHPHPHPTKCWKFNNSRVIVIFTAVVKFKPFFCSFAHLC